MEPTLDRRPAGPGQSLHLPLHKPRDRRHRRLPPPGGSRYAEPNAAFRTLEVSPVRGRPKPSPARTSSSGSSPGRATRSASATVTRSSTGSRRTSEPYTNPCGDGARLQPAEADHRSARLLLHDGRQPWGKRRQPFLGTHPPQLDHRRGLRHLLAAGPHRPPLRAGPIAAGWRGRGGSLPSTAGSAAALSPVPMRPAGAALAGPLVAAAVLLDYSTLSRADRRALAGLHDSKQMSAERREEMYPSVLRAAARVSVVVRCVRGIDAPGLHVTNIEALWRGRWSGSRPPRGSVPAWSTASRCPSCRVAAPRGDRG